MEAPSYLLIGGHAPGRLRRGYAVTRWFGIPRSGEPVMYLPAGSAAALKYALRWLVAPATGPKALRNGMLGVLQRA